MTSLNRLMNIDARYYICDVNTVLHKTVLYCKHYVGYLFFLLLINIFNSSFWTLSFCYSYGPTFTSLIWDCFIGILLLHSTSFGKNNSKKNLSVSYNNNHQFLMQVTEIMWVYRCSKVNELFFSYSVLFHRVPAL